MSDDKMSSFLWLALLSGYLVAVLIGLLGLIVVWKMWTGEIDLSKLISEGPQGGGDASLSRFQFLIFTFVISTSLLLMVVAQIQCADCKHSFSFPDLNNVWALLGISGGSYVISKGIQKNFESNLPKAPTQQPISREQPTPPA